MDEHRHRAGRPAKLVAGTRVFDAVVERLRMRDSPEQIAGRLKRDFPDDEEMGVSHETTYQALYVRPRSELAKQVTQSERPAEADDRAVPGHWEGDLLLGAHNQSAVGTLVERTSGFVLLLHLAHDHTAATVATAMSNAIQRLPEQLRSSMAWDRGSEMALHTKITAELNNRPRKRLDYETPAEAIERLLSNPTESVASTA